MAEMAVFTNMCMITDNSGNVLVQNRRNPDWPGITFPGGKVQPGESFVASAIREMAEETGLTVSNLKLCGTKQFQQADGSRYVVLFFKTSTYSGTLQSSEEGEVFWIPREDLGTYQLSNDFDKMVEVFERDDVNEFHYTVVDKERIPELL